MGNENGRRKSGRKKTIRSSEGKIPQRGMGVAQLEWHMSHQDNSDGPSKKETNPNPILQNPNMFHYSPQTAVHPFYPSYFTDQASAASRSFGKLGPSGLIIGPGQSSSGLGYVYSDHQFPVLDQYGVGPPSSYYQPNSTAGNVINKSCDMSKDMISHVPNIQCRPARVCPKKKRYNGEISESIGGSGERTGKDSFGNFSGSSSVISAGNYQHINYPGQSQDFGTKLSMHNPFPSPKIELEDGGAAVDECKAKGSSMRGSRRNMLMEYEFFPEKEKGEIKSSNIFKDWIRLGTESSSPSVAAAGGYGEANSCLSTTNTSSTGGFGGASSSCIDLSLKLSY